MTAFLIWTTYVISLFYLVSDIFGLITVWLRQAKAIWCYFYTRLWGRLVMASLLYLTAFGLISWWVGGKIDFLNETTLPVQNWDDRRSFGLGVSGFMLTWLAIIGAILSAARTKAMEDTNRETKNNRLNERYENALKSIDGDGLSAIGAIENMKAVAMQDESLRDQIIKILIGYLQRHAKIDDEATGTSSNSDLLRTHFEAALNAIIRLQEKRVATEGLRPEHFLWLNLLDLREVKIIPESQLISISFYDCNFESSFCSMVKFNNVTFRNCALDHSMFLNTSFMKSDATALYSQLESSTFEGTLISGLDLSAATRLERNQMARTKYLASLPPTNFPFFVSNELSLSQVTDQAPQRPVLPPPFDFTKNQYLSRDEALEFHRKTGDKHRPLNNNEEFVPIVDPDDPNIVILDGPSDLPDEPTP